LIIGVLEEAGPPPTVLGRLCCYYAITAEAVVAAVYIMNRVKGAIPWQKNHVP
jgi:hypothetical protein